MDEDEHLHKKLHCYLHDGVNKDLYESLKEEGEPVEESTIDVKVHDVGNHKVFYHEREDRPYSSTAVKKMGEGWYHILGFGPLNGRDKKDDKDNELLKTVVKHIEKDGPVQITYETQQHLDGDREFLVNHDSQFEELTEEHIKKYAEARGKKVKKIDGTTMELDENTHGVDWHTKKPIKNVILAYKSEGKDNYEFRKQG